MNNKYYYSILKNDSEKDLYKKIYNGIKNFDKEIEIDKKWSTRQIHDLYIRILMDTPLFFFVNQNKLSIKKTLKKVIIEPLYIYDKEESKEKYIKVRKITDKIIDNIKAMNLNIFQTEKYFHDSIIKNVEFVEHDRFYSLNAHSIIGVFIEKRAVCEGISKAFKLLCDLAAIKCMIAYGKTNQGFNIKNDSQHAWNIIKINNKSYHIDISWDNIYINGKKYPNYKYFNVTSNYIRKTHQITNMMPLCDNYYFNYYCYTKSVLRNYNDMKEFIENNYEKENILYFKLESDLLLKSINEIKLKMNYFIMLKQAKNITNISKFNIIINKADMAGMIIKNEGGYYGKKK